MLIDLEHNQPIALLSDREAETRAAWLKEHPGVEVVSRVRSKAYAKGITQGAPSAIQVAVRFHLLQNLAETLEQVFGTHAPVLKEVETVHRLRASASEREKPPVYMAPDSRPVVPTFPQNTSLKRKVQSAKARARRRAIHEQVWHLRSQGWSGRAIAQELGVSGHDRV